MMSLRGRLRILRSRIANFNYEEIIKPEDRIHFAGEHASLYHALIQGAFEFGLRAALAVHQAVNARPDR
jgi:monoamine oxidase